MARFLAPLLAFLLLTLARPGISQEDETYALSQFSLNRLSTDVPTFDEDDEFDDDGDDAYDDGGWNFPFGTGDNNDDEDDLDADYLETPIVLDGALVAPWSSCDPASPKEEDCFVETEYADRFLFNFLYGPAEYDFQSPTVTVAAGGTAKPAILDFDFNVDYGIFTVLYNCPADTKDASQTLTLSFPVTKKTSFKFSWIKKCSTGGDHAKVELGYEDEEIMDEVAFKPDQAVLVPTSEPASTLYVKMLEPGTQHQFGEAKVVAADPSIVDLEIRGASFGGVVDTNPSYIYVFYDCKKDGKTKVSITVPFPPMNDLTASWTKECSIADDKAFEENEAVVDANLAIGTELGLSDVLSKGDVTTKYDVPYFDFLKDLDPATHDTVGPNTTRKTFYLQYESADKAQAFEIHDITLTVSDPSVLVARVDEDRPGSVPEDGMLLKPGTAAPLVIRMVCKKKGKANILVSLPVLFMDNIEFGFAKECLRRPRKIKESGFLLTASSIIHVMLFLVVVGCGIAYYYYKKHLAKADVKYSAVAATGDETA